MIGDEALVYCCVFDKSELVETPKGDSWCCTRCGQKYVPYCVGPFLIPKEDEKRLLKTR